MGLPWRGVYGYWHTRTFGYHLKPEQATTIASIKDIIQVLTENGVHFDA